MNGMVEKLRNLFFNKYTKGRKQSEGNVMDLLKQKI